jgi:acetolactate synthase-1/2/3 large subunit
LKVSNYIAVFLVKQKITHVFELIGGMIAHITDSIGQTDGIELISMRHEQGAAFAAEGWARMTGKPGVALATSGPGASNLLTGIGSCYFDSVPAVFITGQVNTHEQRGTSSIRQLGFQEMDIVPMSLPITKWSYKVNFSSEIPQLLRKSFIDAGNNRPGPILLDIPMNLQREDLLLDELIDFNLDVIDNEEVIINKFDHFLKLLKSSKKPLFLVGGGIRSSNAVAEFTEIIEILNIPVVHSLMGIDILPFDHPLRIGFIGAYGNRWANLTLYDSDLLIVLGSRLDVRQTGANIESFINDKKIVRVDIDTGELENRVKGDIAFNSNLLSWIKEFNNSIDEMKNFSRSDNLFWIQTIQAYKIRFPDTSENPGLGAINPNLFIHMLSKASKLAAAYTVDVGNNQMWVAQSIELTNSQRFLTSGGMGAMGFSLPAAIGACFASGKPIVMISGDGGFQINIQELQTIVHHKLPIKMIILNNGTLGMIKQFQDTYFESRLQSSKKGYSAPDFVSIAKAYGVDGINLTKETEIEDALIALWQFPNEPFILNVKIDADVNAYPKMQFGQPLSNMEPTII